MILLALQALLIGGCVAVAAVLSVRRVSGGVDTLGWGWALIPAMAGALALPLAFQEAAFSLQGLILASLGSLLLAMAAADRQTAWAPDALMVPLCLIAGWYCALRLDGWILAGIAGGAILWVAVTAFWMLLTERLPALPPPPDILALALGPVMLGLGFHFGFAIMAAAVILIFIRAFPASLYAFGNAEAARQAGEDLGYEEHHGLAVPLLAILFPIYAAALVANGLYPQLLTF